MTEEEKKMTVLGFDPAMNIPLAGQEGWRPDADDKLPWQVDLSDSANRSGLKEFLQAEANRQEGAPTVHLPDGVIGNVSYSGDKWECRFSFQGTECMATGETRDGAIMAAAKYITSETREPDVVELSNFQLNLIGSLAQAGRLDEALEKFIRLSVTDKKVTATKILSDPRYAEMLDRAAWFVWSRSNNEYTLSDDKFPFFLEKFAAGKRFTLALLNEAWKLYREQGARREREQVVAARFAEPTDAGTVQAGLEEASDSELQEMYRATAKALTHAAR